MALDHPFGGGGTPGRAMCFGVDRMGPYWTRSFMENPAFTGPSLSDITLMMVIMCVLVVELLCQAVTGSTRVLVARCVWVL
jgi:hypothetical protein